MKIYIASKTKHAPKWQILRDAGVNIISTWIDESEVGQSPNLADLCSRCISESISCDAMIVYAEDGDYLKGAFIEMGAALSVPNKPIYLVGCVLPYGSAFTYSHQVFTANSITEALRLLKQPTP